MRGYYAVLLGANLLLVLVLFLHPRTKGAYWRNKPLFFAPLLPMIPFLLWDLLGQQRSWWQFRTGNILGISVLGLPIEEVLFFYIVPFATLCVWVAVRPRKVRQ